MARLVLINGAPGSGKSTIAAALAQDRPMTLALDVDLLKHSLGRWSEAPDEAGLRARALTLSLAREQLVSGYDVVIGQYLARTEFIVALEQLAAEIGAAFAELVLDLDAASLAERLGRRATEPTRTEHGVNNTLVGADDASRLVASLEDLRHQRPSAVWVDARGEQETTLARVRAAL